MEKRHHFFKGVSSFSLQPQQKKMTNTKQHILVYGTLRKDQPLNPCLQSGTLIDTIEVDRYKMFSNGSFPMIKEGLGTITCEVYEFTQENFNNIIPDLDNVESAYNRKEIDITLKGKKHKAWIYIYKYPIKDYLPIPKGDWIRHHESLKIRTHTFPKDTPLSALPEFLEKEKSIEITRIILELTGEVLLEYK